MKAIKYILFLLLILIIGFSIYIAVQPNSFEVERSRTINAPVEVVYNTIIDFKNWEVWNSWKEKKPEIQITLAEKTNGIGGSYSWEDEDSIGKMETIDTEKNKYIAQTMQFDEFPTSNVYWKFTSNEDGSTTVKRSINGEDLPFVFKAYTTLMGGMEKLIGPYYERDFELLDQEIQKDMKRYSINVEGVTRHSGGFYLYNTTSCKMSDFKEKMTEMFPKIGGYALANNIRMAGAPFVIYHKWDEVNDAVMFSCAIPTTSKMTTNESEILTGQLESFKAVKTILNGNYENLKEAWEKTMAYIESNNLETDETGPMIEAYLTDVTSHPNPADWITEIYIAIK
ncbi:MAG: transcription activator effector-binding protein [Winogradskyella sp.]|uniref:SRPBCC family protein n=1 Tax=Winogradskyella sp. TaxID=1883156 RepID=UPI001839F0E5|nr:GyrI-like domain-containing protein [Winogradskyella sp.]MBT8245354.1 SRPBCC family protein [Winogradskyella sp.]NNK23643.1 transcription activator effector-binding protein [Winogradskyella sp.]